MIFDDTITPDLLWVTDGALQVGVSTGGSPTFSAGRTDTDVTTTVCGKLTNKQTVENNGSYFATGWTAQVSTEIATGKTNSGYARGMFFEGARGEVDDNGTLNELMGAYLTYGHYGGFSAPNKTTNQAYGLYIDSKGEAGTINNAYDIYLSEMLLGGTVTNHWAIYQSDPNVNSYFAGQIIGGDLNLLGDTTSELDIRRTTKSLDNTNITGSGTIEVAGDFSNATDLDYKIEITTGGDVGTAVFRWSDDGGSTWDGSSITTPESRIPYTLNNGLRIWFNPTDFNANDYTTFTGIGTNNQKNTLLVDTTNNDVTLVDIVTVSTAGDIITSGDVIIGDDLTVSGIVTSNLDVVGTVSGLVGDFRYLENSRVAIPTAMVVRDNLIIRNDLTVSGNIVSNLSMLKADPEIRLTDTGDSINTRWTRSDTSAEMSVFNACEKPGGSLGALAQWNLNDDAPNTTVVEENGTYTGTATSNTDTFNSPGHINTGLDMNLNDYVTVADHDDLSFGDSASDDPFSVVSWVEVELSGTFQMAIGKWDATLGEREWLFDIAGDETIYWQLYDESSNKSPVQHSDDALTAGWHLVVCTYDGGGGGTAANGMKIYVDGSLVSSTGTNQALYVAMENTNSPLYIGTYSAAGALKWKAQMDAQMVFDTELSQAEITDLWNGGVGREVTAGADREVTVLTSEDGTGGNEAGITTLTSYDAANAVYGRVALDGKTLRFNISGTEKAQIDGSGNLDLKSMSVTAAKINFAADAEASDTYVITLDPAPTAYTTGMMITFTANTANTGACTVNVNSLGAKSLKSLHDQDPANDYIESGSVVVAVYDGTNFQIIQPDANP